MTTLTLKNFPAKLYLELQARARRNRRSLNQEAIRCLERAIAATPSPTLVAKRLAEFRAARRRIKGVHLTDRDINAAKNAGRR